MFIKLVAFVVAASVSCGALKVSRRWGDDGGGGMKWIRLCTLTSDGGSVINVTVPCGVRVRGESTVEKTGAHGDGNVQGDHRHGGGYVSRDHHDGDGNVHGDHHDGGGSVQDHRYGGGSIPEDHRYGGGNVSRDHHDGGGSVPKDHHDGDGSVQDHRYGDGSISEDHRYGGGNVSRDHDDGGGSVPKYHDDGGGSVPKDHDDGSGSGVSSLGGEVENHDGGENATVEDDGGGGGTSDGGPHSGVSGLGETDGDREGEEYDDDGGGGVTVAEAPDDVVTAVYAKDVVRTHGRQGHDATADVVAVVSDAQDGRPGHRRRGAVAEALLAYLSEARNRLHDKIHNLLNFLQRTFFNAKLNHRSRRNLIEQQMLVNGRQGNKKKQSFASVILEPTFERSLMTMSFLMFGVFVIQVVQRLMQTLQPYGEITSMGNSVTGNLSKVSSNIF